MRIPISLSQWVLLVIGSVLFQSIQAQPFTQYDPVSRKEGVWDAATYQPILPCIFDEVIIQKGPSVFFIGKKDNKKSLYDSEGRQLVPFFDQLYFTMKSIPGLPDWVIVGKEVSGEMRYGIYQTGKGLVLPVTYKEVYAIYPDLIAGRVVDPPQEIHFFDQKGTFLFAKEGNSADRGYNDQTILVRRPGKNWLYFDKKGNDPFPSGYTNPVWMKDNLLIAGDKGAVGLFGINGDTILPPSYTMIKPEGMNRFIVRDQAGNWGLSNEQGDFLIPMQPRRELVREHWEEEEVFFTRNADRSSSEVFDREGKSLAKDIQLSFPNLDPSFYNALPNQAPWKYFTLRNNSNNLVGLFRKNGKPLLPMDFATIKYYSELHPFLASKNQASEQGVTYWQAYNALGKPLLDRDFVELNGTASPEWLIGLPIDKGKKWGFIPIKKPAEAKFIYDQIIPMLHGCYAAKQGDRWYLLNTEGKKIVEKGYSALNTPMNLQVQQFFTERHKGPLVAAATEPGAPMGHWVALTLKGKVIPMSAPPYHPMNEVELIAVDEAPPPVEEMPSTIEINPQFPGGEAALLSYLMEQLKYPTVARENGIEGRVIVSFVVETDGSLSTIRVLRDIGGGCGEEAVRLVKGMPKWVPGQTNGRVVKKEYTLPVRFALN